MRYVTSQRLPLPRITEITPTRLRFRVMYDSALHLIPLFSTTNMSGSKGKPIRRSDVSQTEMVRLGFTPDSDNSRFK